jgi:hypothetical protein
MADRLQVTFHDGGKSDEERFETFEEKVAPVIAGEIGQKRYQGRVELDGGGYAEWTYG